MPGFNIQSQDNQKSINNKAEFRRKHRWRVTTSEFLNSQQWLYLQKAQRPNFKYEEPVVHHDQEQVYFAGKQSWEPITFAFYDVEDAGGNAGDVSAAIYDWVAGPGADSVGLHLLANMRTPSEYKNQLILEMTDAAGDPTESWTLFGAWPVSVNWMDLDYTNTEIQLIEVVIRYDRAARNV